MNIVRDASLLTVVGLLLAAGALPAAATPPEPPLTWLSTGDSYSSGEGVRGNAGNCAQSDQAWGPSAARLLADEDGWNISTPVFSACTGHSVEDLYNARPSDESSTSLWDWSLDQPGAPDSGRFDIVTLSFGGNDIGFTDVILDCLAAPIHRYDDEFLQRSTLVTGPTAFADIVATGSADVVPFLGDNCDASEDEIEQRIDSLFDPDECGPDAWRGGGRSEVDNFACELVIDATTGATGSIVDFWIHVLERSVTDEGLLVVQGYPPLFAESGRWGLLQGLRCNGITRGDANMLGQLARHLDQRLADGVELANSILGTERILYSSVIDTYSDGDRSLCGTDGDWINGSITVTRDEPLFLASPFRPVTVNPAFRFRHLGAFHPTASAHQAEAAQVAALIREHGVPLPGSGDGPIDRQMFSGAWSGSIKGADSTFDAAIEMRVEDNRLVGTIRHRELPCEGSLSELIVTADAAVLAPAYAPDSNCIQNGTHRLTLVDDDTLTYEWFHPTTDRIDRGRLTRVDPGSAADGRAITFTAADGGRSTFSDSDYADVIDVTAVEGFTVAVRFEAFGGSDLRRPETSCLVSDSNFVAVPLSTTLEIDEPGHFAGTQSFPLIVPGQWSLRYSCQPDFTAANVGTIQFPHLGISVFSGNYYATVLDVDRRPDGTLSVRFASHGYTKQLNDLREPGTSCVLAGGVSTLPASSRLITEVPGVHYDGTLVFDGVPDGPASFIYSCSDDYSTVVLG